MKAEQAELMQSDLGRNDRNTIPASVPQTLKLADRQERNRVQRLADLARTLLREAETLAADKDFTEESNKLRTMNLSEGIDFYDEVVRFETNLIKLALERT